MTDCSDVKDDDLAQYSGKVVRDREDERSVMGLNDHRVIALTLLERKRRTTVQVGSP